MSVFRFDDFVGRARGARALPLLLREKLINKKKLLNKRQELRRTKDALSRTADRQKRLEHKKTKKRMVQEIFRLENDLRCVAEGERSSDAPNGQQAPQAATESATGALPDFVIIGAKKCGTTFLYDLLARHPHVEPAAKKELHYFDILADEESIEWYRRCFPPPKWKDGRRTITGEATPYLDKSRVPKRMAKVVPQARLIVLLRNPVDRAYSDYQQRVRKGRETRTFEEDVEEAVEAVKARLLRKEDEASEHGERAGFGDARRGYLSRSIYVDHLLHWSRFFGDEQILVLKSEDLFERTTDTLKLVLEFLDLPNWEPGVSESPEKRNEGKYEPEMDPATRQRLEEYFESHNERLYEHLGVDFEW